MSETTLLERDTAGLHVEVTWLPITDTLVLRAINGDFYATATIPADRALDAFDHPTIYLDDSDVARLFPRPTSAV